MSIQHFIRSQSVWEKFCLARLDYVKTLAMTVQTSFLRRDTTHPAFCGCLDWHSSVHGAYALLTAARIVTQPRWAGMVDAAFKADCLEEELASIRRGELNHELPYGYAWFLRLAREREEGWGKTDLRSMAIEIADRIAQWLNALSDEAVHEHAQRREYGNLSWPLLNLWEWESWNGNARQAGNLVQWTRSRLLPLDLTRPFSPGQATEEFFAPALQRCRALLTILPQEESQKWLQSVGRNHWDFLPVTMPSTAHGAGLNFSRSWGLWTLFEHTKDLAFRDMFIDHIVTHMEMPEYWRDDYRKHGHWVPQFGIYAIALSLEADSI